MGASGPSVAGPMQKAVGDALIAFMAATAKLRASCDGNRFDTEGSASTIARGQAEGGRRSSCAGTDEVIEHSIGFDRLLAGY
jgi:hypothetical protein